MFIKTLTIQGFKSYRDQTQIEPFSPKHNVVVGRNGSGKSNFFAAIRFVLSDAYTSMTKEERQSLLHEGVSVAQTMSAYVEIVFDNSDHRFPSNHDEVVLRRTIGIKKDEYSLDKKSASKADVMSLLESAGFSKANPYYIVPQGRITALTNAKDHERLTLLKEVAGTKVYEQRRAESIRIMEETDSKRTKIVELLDYIDSRLSELEEEKEELKEFQQQDKERRCLEYAMFQRELEDVAAALEEIEEERRNEVHGSNQRREQFSSREQESHALERKIGETKHEHTTTTLARKGAGIELTDLLRTQKELELRIADLRAADERAGGRRTEFETELETIEAQIRAKEAELAQLAPQWDQHRVREAELRKSHDEARGKLSALFAKQGHISLFRTRGERDSFLNSEVQSLDAHRQRQQTVLAAQRTELQSAEDALASIEDQLNENTKRAEDGRSRVHQLNEQIVELTQERAELSEKRKELWREDAKVDSARRHAQDEFKSAERSLSSMMDRDTGSGLRAVDAIAERLHLDGVYGPLYRLFEITEPAYNTAVELTAGNSLFHVVVDNDQTASRVLEVMLRERTGRVTFMPLNRLRPKNPTLPDTDDAITLLKKLRYNSAHEKAFLQVFGKTAVCRDLSLAAAYVKSHGINTITLDGDKVDRKGALTGGYHDVRRSRIEAIRAVAEWRGKFEIEDRRQREIKKEITETEQKLAQVAGKIQVAVNQQQQARGLRDSLQAEVAALLKQKDRVQERIAKLQEDILQLEGDISGSDARLGSYRDELTSPMANGLTPEEEAAVEQLQKEVDAIQRELVEMSKTKNQLGSKKNLLQIELSENLRRKRDELRAKIEALGQPDIDDATAGEDLKVRERELQALNASIENLKIRIEEADNEIEKLSISLRELREKQQAIQNQQAEDSSGMAKQQKNTERYMAKRNLLLGRKDDCNRQIRDLGVLPEEAFEKYTNEKLERLAKKLQAVKESLKKFAHVNKKAFEQYSNFTKQRDQLLERRAELDGSAKSIQALVEQLDWKKDEAIDRTFNQVASNFEDVFGKLVPAGKGKLIIQRRVDLDEADEAEDTQQSNIDNYTGVSIKVSFNSKVDEGLRIQQLSGGQKSLVALALVFAIQKCDPAPFYLFDEIDANLDAQYRTAVAAMIHELSESAQFITTTFRPEMLVHADKFYGVLFNNQKVSTIRTIKREEAMEFVDQEAQAQ